MDIGLGRTRGGDPQAVRRAARVTTSTSATLSWPHYGIGTMPSGRGISSSAKFTRPTVFAAIRKPAKSSIRRFRCRRHAELFGSLLLLLNAANRLAGALTDLRPAGFTIADLSQVQGMPLFDVNRRTVNPSAFGPIAGNADCGCSCSLLVSMNATSRIAATPTAFKLARRCLSRVNPVPVGTSFPVFKEFADVRSYPRVRRSSHGR